MITVNCAADYRGRGKWFRGKLGPQLSDGTWEVKYDDGDSETRVDEKLIRSLEAPAPDVGGGKEDGAVRLEEGMRVEGACLCQCGW